MPFRIDINCDLGEGFGVYRLYPEEEIYPLISSANIACGFHGGDPQTMRHSVRLAAAHQVSIGAHPGTPDLIGFGRRSIELSLEEIENAMVYQIGALDAFARATDTRLSHVKPHGWLYNAAAARHEVAMAIARAVKSLSPTLTLFGLSGSESIKAAKQVGLPCAQEAFADRAYRSDGTLVPRTFPGAVITQPGRAAQQALDLVLKGSVRCLDGTILSVQADTLCIHGDNPQVLRVLAAVRKQLQENGVEILPPGARA